MTIVAPDIAQTTVDATSIDSVLDRRSLATVIVLTVLHLALLLAFQNPLWMVPAEAIVLTVTIAAARRRKIASWVAWAFAWAWTGQLIEPAYGFWPATWLYMIPLLYLLRDAPSMRALFVRGAWAGFLLGSGLFVWLKGAIVRFFEVGQAGAVAGYLAAVMPIALQMGLVLVLTRLLSSRLKVATPIALAVVYTLFEYWYTWPLPIHYFMALARAPFLLQPADLFGAHGVSLLTAIESGMLGAALMAWKAERARSLQAIGIFAALLLLHASYSGWAWQRYADTPGAPTLSVAMVQPMAPLKIHARDAATRSNAAQRLARLSREAAYGTPPPDLLIWPEGGAVVAARTPAWNPEYMAAAGDAQRGTSVPLLLNGIEFASGAGETKLRYYSVVDLLDASGMPTVTYRKALLMPFTEALPGADTFPFLRRWFPQSRSLLAGASATTIPGPKSTVIGPLICYEVLSGDYTRQLVRGGATWLVNLTNDEWYGVTQQPRQHLSFAQLRAIENRRAVARCTNSGITAVVDARGSLQAVAPIQRETSLRGSLQPRMDLTVFARVGPLLHKWILPLGIFALALFHRRRLIGISSHHGQH